MAEEEQGYLLDAASIRQLREDHEYLMAMAMVPSRRRLITRGGGGGGAPVAEGRLLTAISPASNHLTGGSGFTFVRFIVDSDNPTQLKEEVDDQGQSVETEGVNRSTVLQANSGAYVVCMKVNKEWRPIVVEDICVE